MLQLTHRRRPDMAAPALGSRLAAVAFPRPEAQPPERVRSWQSARDHQRPADHDWHTAYERFFGVPVGSCLVDPTLWGGLATNAT
jgi:hypothetical protein